MSGPADAEYSGCLARKKNNHGRFEDPWKQKVFCWIAGGGLHLCPAGPDKRPVNVAQRDTYRYYNPCVRAPSLRALVSPHHVSFGT